ncbi:glutathione S-transferase N-terminal domain-containing protein [Gluconacetobacter sacchari]|uniref:glutathione S-transferase N-terminal domain-containing protein n=1 Tax=Gluconacetobacter sacchari TaxID=92759 RepID=UPI0039B62CFB
MILYASPGGCSQASHIALVEAGIPYTLVKVGRDKKTDDGRDFNTLNPKGYTPALELDDGTVLTESLVILSYIADMSGRLLAKNGHERWRALEILEFMTTEVHGAFRALFRTDSAEADKDKSRTILAGHFGLLNGQRGERAFLVGEQVTIADTYLFVMLSWAAMMGIALPERLAAYAARMRQMPSVTHALVAEGLA